MDNLSGTNGFLDHFILDPLERFKAEQTISDTQHDEPFKIVPTSSKSPVKTKTPKPISRDHCKDFHLTGLHMTILMPENLKVTVGEYTFALSSHLKIGIR